MTKIINIIDIDIDIETDDNIEKVTRKVDITIPLKYVGSINYTNTQKFFLGFCGYFYFFDLNELLNKLKNNILKLSIIKSNVDNEIKNNIIKLKKLKKSENGTECKVDIKNNFIKLFVTFTIYDIVEKELKKTIELIQAGIYLSFFINILSTLTGIAILFRAIPISSMFTLILLSITTTLFIMSIFGYSKEYFKNFEIEFDEFLREVSQLKV